MNMLRAKRNLSILGTCALALGLGSCEDKSPVYDNPNDQLGNNWSPPTVKVVTRQVTAGINDSVRIKVVGTDANAEDHLARLAWFSFYGGGDSVQFKGDTAVATFTIAQAGRRVVYFRTCDNQGVWSIGMDSAVLDIHQYPPVATIKALKDSVEPGEAVQFAIAWSDTTPGNAVKYQWLVGATDTTTADSIRNFQPRTAGIFTVGARVTDDDGNISLQTMASVVVRPLVPWVDSLDAKDTAEWNKPFKITLFARDNKPGKMAKYFVSNGSKVDSSSDSIVTVVPNTADSLVVTAWVRDKDGNRSDILNDRTLAVPVVIRRPTATIQAPDSGEINRPVLFTLTAKDSDTGRVVKYVWTYGTKTDTTTAATHTFVLSNAGMMSVSGRALDNDGNLSLPVEKSVPIKAHAPTLKFKSSSDTVKIGFGMPLTLGWTVSDAPTDPKGDSVAVTWKTSDNRSGTGSSFVLKDSVEKLVQVDVVAKDRDSLKTTATAWVKFMPIAPQIVSPAVDTFLNDTTIEVKWTASYLDSSFEVLADTLPNPTKSRAITTKTSAIVQLPFWSKTWYVKVVASKAGVKANSSVVKFFVGESKSTRTQLVDLKVSGYIGSLLQSDVGIVFNPKDTVYDLVVKPVVTSLTLVATGDVDGQIIKVVDSQLTVGTTKSMTQRIDLKVSPISVAVIVRSANKARTRTYTIRVSKAYPKDLLLDSLGLDNGYSLVPRFHPDSNAYTVEIPAGDSTTLGYRSNGVSVVRLSRSGQIASRVLHGSLSDTSALMVKVGLDKDTNYYQIKVQLLPSRDPRLQSLVINPSLPLAPLFHPDSVSYLVQAPEGRDTITFLPTLKSGQTATANGVAVGSVATPLKLKLGVTTLSLVVTAADGKTKRNYNIVFNRNASTKSWLTGIAVIKGMLSPTFDSTVLKYRVVLPFRQDSASVKFKGGAPFVREIRINDVATPANTYAPMQRLKGGDSTTFKIKVLAEDTTATTTYQVIVVRSMPDTSRTLTGLGVKSTKGKLVMNDIFAGSADTVLRGGTEFNDSLLVVTPSWILNTLNSVKSGSKVLTTGKSDTVKLKPNDTTEVSIVVTPEDSTKPRTYSIRIFRGAASRNANLSSLKWVSNRVTTAVVLPVATDSVFAFSVPFVDTMLKIAAAASDTDVFIVRVQGMPLAKGSATNPILLAAGAVNEIRVEVLAQDTTRKKVYFVRVTRLAKSRDSAMASLTANARSGAVDLSLRRGDTTWVATVPFEDSAIWLKPTARDSNWATIKVNGKVVASGSKSDSILLPIVGDANSISLVVTAEDTSSHQEYNVIIVRGVPGSNANLSNLVVASGTRPINLTPVFTKADTLYSAIVANSDAQVTVSPVSDDVGAREILVNGLPVVSGGKSGAIALAANNTTTLTIQVTAQDSVTKRTYEVKIFRNAVESVLVRSSIPTGTTLTRTYFPRLFVDAGVDTTGLQIRVTADGQDPALSDTGLSNNIIMSFGAPMRLRASAWRNGSRIGPVQEFLWLMDSCVYDFETPDSGFILWDAWRVANNVPLADSMNYWTGLRGWGWASEQSNMRAQVAAGSLGMGKSYQFSYNLNGTNYPSAGIGIEAPYNPIASKRGGQNYGSLTAIGMRVKRISTSLAVQYVSINITPDPDGDPIGHAAAIVGANYRWTEPIAAGYVKDIRLDLADAEIPAWAVSQGIVTTSIQTQLANFNGVEISQGCSSTSGTCTNVSGSVEFDRLVYYFE